MNMIEEMIIWCCEQEQVLWVPLGPNNRTRREKNALNDNKIAVFKWNPVCFSIVSNHIKTFLTITTIDNYKSKSRIKWKTLVSTFTNTIEKIIIIVTTATKTTNNMTENNRICWERERLYVPQCKGLSLEKIRKRIHCATKHSKEWWWNVTIVPSKSSNYTLFNQKLLVFTCDSCWIILERIKRLVYVHYALHRFVEFRPTYKRGRAVSMCVLGNNHSIFSTFSYWFNHKAAPCLSIFRFIYGYGRSLLLLLVACPIQFSMICEWIKSSFRIAKSMTLYAVFPCFRLIVSFFVPFGIKATKKKILSQIFWYGVDFT